MDSRLRVSYPAADLPPDEDHSGYTLLSIPENKPFPTNDEIAEMLQAAEEELEAGATSHDAEILEANICFLNAMLTMREPFGDKEEE